MSGRIDKAELISKLQTLEGLTIDERSSLIGLLREHKKYGLVWEDKPEDVEERLREELPVLREVKDKRIIGVQPDLKSGCSEYKDLQSDRCITNADTHSERIANPLERPIPNHILIEGDNLEALTALSYTHEGKIDVIYIDPPYNTGNKDFVYNDSFVDTEDSYRHSKWLSFMSKRLKIAKKLLSDKGVIFISIDDNEQANLKLLCDEVFGEQNFITNFVWQSTAGSNTGTDIITVTEYILVYTKNRSNITFDGQLTNEESFPYTDEFYSERGKFSLDKLDRRRVGGHYSDALNYPIVMPDGTLRYPGGGSQKSDEGWNYLWSKTKIEWGKANGFIVFKKSKGQWNVYNKRYSRIDNMGKPIDRSVPFRNLITSDLYNTAQGTAEITSIFGIRSFDFPKPSSLVKHLLLTIARSNKSSIILDFFAGSGTTLHATMQLNAEDGGHRQCILVTNNENGICEQVTYERNKRVIQGYTTPKGVKVEGLKANTLRYYKTDYISRDRTQKNMRDLVAAATDLLCIKEDLYEEQPTFGRFRLKPQLARYFNNGRKHILIIYREELIDEIVEEIKRLSLTPDPSPKERGVGILKIYVFSPGRYAFNDNFREVEDKVELVALPAAIYDAYQKVLPKRREKLLELGITNPLQQESGITNPLQQGTKIPTDLFEGQGV